MPRLLGASMFIAVVLTLAPTASSSDVTATITLGGPSVTVTIAGANDNARITFDGTAGQRVFVNLTGVTIGTSSCCSVLASILKPDGSTMTGTTKYVGTSGGYLDTVTLPTAGTYTIFLDPQGRRQAARRIRPGSGLALQHRLRMNVHRSAARLQDAPPSLGPSCLPCWAGGAPRR